MSPNPRDFKERMNKLRYGWLVLLTAGCVQTEPANKKEFDFDALLDEQVSLLSQSGAVLEKSAVMESQGSDTTFLPTADGWQKELELFRQMDLLNKPANLLSFVKQDSIKDSKSNLRIREYTSTSAPLSQMKIYYLDNINRIRRIEAVITDKNLLHMTQQRLQLNFEEDNQRPLLNSYAIEGYEKMILSDTVRYSIRGHIDW